MPLQQYRTGRKSMLRLIIGVKKCGCWRVKIRTYRRCARGMLVDNRDQNTMPVSDEDIRLLIQ